MQNERFFSIIKAEEARRQGYTKFIERFKSAFLQWLGENIRKKNSPQPHRHGSDLCSTIGHYGAVPQGELDGDETFNADQREMKNDDGIEGKV